MRHIVTIAGSLLACLLLVGCQCVTSEQSEDLGFRPLFPANGLPQGWVPRAWNDVSKPPAEPSNWEVVDGVLMGGVPRGSWLMSEQEYDDFILEFEFKLGERGNSGCALRAPMKGDPAFDGIELQMADFRYNTAAKDSELTGGLYRAVAPLKQVYRPTEWNTYRIKMLGNKMEVRLNGVKIQDLDLSKQNAVVLRHDNSRAPAIKDRPKRGHIGFQELSREGGRASIRNARIKVLK